MKPYTPPPAEATQGASLFWGGVARVDIVKAPQALRLSFCGFGLRVTSCATEEAEAYHLQEAGVSLTPPNDPESAAALGPLQLRKKVQLSLTQGRHTADIAVSGLGWVAVSRLCVRVRVRVRLGGGEMPRWKAPPTTARPERPRAGLTSAWGSS